MFRETPFPKPGASLEISKRAIDNRSTYVRFGRLITAPTLLGSGPE